MVFAAFKIVEFAEFRWLWNFRRSEFWLGIAAFVAVLTLDLLVGDRVRRPAVGHGHAGPGGPTARGGPRARSPAWRACTTSASTPPRPRSRACSCSATTRRCSSPTPRTSAPASSRRSTTTRREGREVRRVLLNCEAMVDADSTAVGAMQELVRELQRRDIEVSLARVHVELAELLERAGILGLVGADNVYPTLPTAVAGYREDENGSPRDRALSAPTDVRRRAPRPRSAAPSARVRVSPRGTVGAGTHNAGGRHMLEASEVGNKLSKEEFKAIEPQLRVDLVNAQYDLKSADFGVLIFVAGDDRIAGNEVVNRINEWMDARFIQTHVMGPLTSEESMRPRYWRVWRDMPAKGRIALMAGGIMRLLHENLAGELSDDGLRARDRPPRADAGGPGRRRHADHQGLPAHAGEEAAQADEEGRGRPRRGLAHRPARLGDAGPARGEREQAGEAAAPHVGRRRPVVGHRGDRRALPRRRRGPHDPQRHHRAADRGHPRGRVRQRPAVLPRRAPGHGAGHRGPHPHHRQGHLRQGAQQAPARGARAGPSGPGPRPVDRAGLRGLGRRRQGRCDPPDHPGAGGRRLPRDLHGGPDRGGAQVPLPVAVLARPARRPGSS